MTTKEQMEVLINLYGNLHYTNTRTEEGLLTSDERVKLIKLTIKKLTKLVNTI